MQPEPMREILRLFESQAFVKGITLWQPWAWCITDLPEDIAKRLENRGWPPWPLVRFLAIHAGSTYHKASATSISDTLGIDVPTRSQIVMKSIVGICRIAGCVTESDDQWFAGPYGWVLSDVVRLPEPIPFKGAQGLWQIPTPIRMKLGEIYCAAQQDRLDRTELEPRTGMQLRVPGL